MELTLSQSAKDKILQLNRYKEYTVPYILSDDIEDWYDIPETVWYILTKLRQRGYEAYMVGGCVRDLVMGIWPKDFDITTQATPEHMKGCISLRSYDTGLKHGTVTFVDYDNDQYEVTTYRMDGRYSDSRHPDEVEYVNNLIIDLSRRDFTINAMAIDDICGGIIDPFGGLNDLKNGLIRCVGNPDDRFKEDPLRILRALRFSAVYGFKIEDETSKSIHSNVSLLDSVSKERISNELLRMFSEYDYGPSLEYVLLEYKDVMNQIIPDLGKCFDFDQHNKHHCYDLYTHMALCASTVLHAPEKDGGLVVLAALLHDIGKPYCVSVGDDREWHYYDHTTVSSDIARNICKDLKLSNWQTEWVCTLIRFHDPRPKPTKKSVRKFVSKVAECYYGEKTMKEFIDQEFNLMEADIETHSEYSKEYSREQFREMKSLYWEVVNDHFAFKTSDLCIDGNDLKSMGFEPGPIYSTILATVLDKVVDEELTNDRYSLLRYVEKNFKKYLN